MEKKPKEIITWLKSHPYFKWSGMCRELKIDAANFHKVMESKTPKLKDEIILQIEVILKNYGFGNSSKIIYSPLTEEPKMKNDEAPQFEKEVEVAIRKIKDEKIPKDRDTSLGRKYWNIEQQKRIKELEDKLK